MGKYEHAITVAVLIYLQWTEAQHRAKMSKWKLKLNKKGTLRLLSKTEKIPSGNCDSGRSHETGIDIQTERSNGQKCTCDHGRSVNLSSVD